MSIVTHWFACLANHASSAGRRVAVPFPGVRVCAKGGRGPLFWLTTGRVDEAFGQLVGERACYKVLEGCVKWSAFHLVINNNKSGTRST